MGIKHLNRDKILHRRNTKVQQACAGVDRKTWDMFGVGGKRSVDLMAGPGICYCAVERRGAGGRSGNRGGGCA